MINKCCTIATRTRYVDIEECLPNTFQSHGRRLVFSGRPETPDSSDYKGRRSVDIRVVKA